MNLRTRLRHVRYTRRDRGLGWFLGLLLVGCGPIASETTLGESRQALAAGTGLSTTAVQFIGAEQEDRLGEFMTGVGDVNGDGFDDLAVGAPLWQLPNSYTSHEELGRVYLFFGSVDGVRAADVQTLDGTEYNGRRARPVRAGDVNGDGYADVVIQGTILDAEAALPELHLGGPDGLSAEPVWTTTALEAYVGGGLGDLTGDGRAEVATKVVELTENGREYWLYIYGGTETGLTEEPVFRLPTYAHGVGIGDFNGDGYNDYFGGTTNCEGITLGYFGAPNGLAAAADWVAVDVDCDKRTGTETERVGDLDADGYADVFTSSKSYARFDFPGYAQGYYGAAEPDAEPDWSASFPENNTGWLDMAGVGDVNGDGYNDVVIGLDNYTNPAGEHPFPVGRARLYLGSAAGLDASSSWWAYDETLNSSSFASVVTGAGDLNGDGFADLAVADYLAETEASLSRQGFVYVFYGRGGDEPAGRVLWALNVSEPGSTDPLAGGARLESSDSFDVSCIGLGSEGRSFVSLEVEVKPAAVDFDGLALVRAETWHDTGVSGVALSQSITGLESNTAHKWRARLVYRPDSPTLTSHTRWFEGPSVITNCDASDPNFDADGLCDDLDSDDDEDGTEDDLDCAPFDAEIHVGQAEVVGDGVDQDCSGQDTVACYLDADDDGYGVSETTLGEGDCTAPQLSDNDTDCDDESEDLHPGASETPSDDIDQDCDGQDGIACFVDTDEDGFGAAEVVVPEADCPADGLSDVGGDCNDAATEAYPGAAEIPDDGIDQNCSGLDSVTCYQDRDGDGYGAATSAVREGECSEPDTTAAPGDCDDEADSSYPGAEEVADDGIDQDCDGADGITCFVDDDCDAPDKPANLGGAPSMDPVSSETGGSSPTDGSSPTVGGTPAPQASNDSGGCGCRIVPRTQSQRLGPLLLAVLAGGCIRRRRPIG